MRSSQIQLRALENWLERHFGSILEKGMNTLSISVGTFNQCDVLIYLCTKKSSVNINFNYRSTYSFSNKKRAAFRSTAGISLNEWLTYYNLRANQIEIMSGTATVVRLKPVQHVASDNFKSVTQEKRGCRFLDEQREMTKGHDIIHKIF